MICFDSKYTYLTNSLRRRSIRDLERLYNYCQHKEFADKKNTLLWKKRKLSVQHYLGAKLKVHHKTTG